MPLPQHVQKIIGAALMLSVLVLACWIRIPKDEQLPDGQFTETDGYFYYWQALLVAEQGIAIWRRHERMWNVRQNTKLQIQVQIPK